MTVSSVVERSNRYLEGHGFDSCTVGLKAIASTTPPLLFNKITSVESLCLGQALLSDAPSETDCS